MKKFFKAASILAAVSMLFAFASCQQDPETPSTSGTAAVFKAETKTVDLSSISVASVTEVSSDNEKVATATKEGAEVTVKSVSKGTAKITAKVTGADSKTGTAEISVTVAETGKITVSGTPSVTWDKQEEPEPPAATGTVWEFETAPDCADSANSNKITQVGASLAADSGSTATLTVALATDLKWAGTDEHYLQAGKNSKTADVYATGAKAQLTLTTTETATIEILESGSGGAPGNYRWIVVTNASGEVVGQITESLSGEQNTCTIEAAPVGVYTIYMNGSRIHSIKVN